MTAPSLPPDPIQGYPDAELYVEYQRAKADFPKWRVAEFQLEIVRRWEGCVSDATQGELGASTVAVTDAAGIQTSTIAALDALADDDIDAAMTALYDIYDKAVDAAYDAEDD